VIVKTPANEVVPPSAFTTVAV
jgi:hypothetical protein